MTDSSKTRFECRSLLIYAVLNTVLNDNGGGGKGRKLLSYSNYNISSKTSTANKRNTDYNYAGSVCISRRMS